MLVAEQLFPFQEASAPHMSQHGGAQAEKAWFDGVKQGEGAADSEKTVEGPEQAQLGADGKEWFSSPDPAPAQPQKKMPSVGDPELDKIVEGIGTLKRDSEARQLADKTRIKIESSLDVCKPSGTPPGSQHDYRWSGRPGMWLKLHGSPWPRTSSLNVSAVWLWRLR